MCQTKVTQKLETHFMFKNFFFPENRAEYEKMWENIVQTGRPRKTI
jgi:hypothetical protein